jgi:hypothetical protein
MPFHATTSVTLHTTFIKRWNIKGEKIHCAPDSILLEPLSLHFLIIGMAGEMISKATETSFDFKARNKFEVAL